MRHLLAATIVVATVSFLRPIPAFAQVDEVRIGVDGMTCNLCAAGLERALRRLEGVSSVKVALADQSAVVKLKPGAAFDPDTFRTAVRDAGQLLRRLELGLRGAVRHQDGAYRLEPRPGVSMAVERISAARLQSYVGRVVRVRARVTSPPQSPLELELTELAIP